MLLGGGGGDYKKKSFGYIFFNGGNAVINTILLPANYFMLHNPSNLDFAYEFFKWKAYIQGT